MNIDKSTLARCIVLAIIAILDVLRVFGVTLPNIEQDVLYTGVLTIISIIGGIYTTWKNADFTTAAQMGTAYMKSIKANIASAFGGEQTGNDADEHEGSDPTDEEGEEK